MGIYNKHVGGKTMLLLDGLMESDNIFRKGLRKEFGTISAVNIKEIKDTNKNNRRTFNGWGLFIDILLDDKLTKLTCVWSFNDQFTIDRRPMGMLPTGFMDPNNAPGYSIGGVLNALDVKETKDLIGMEVKIKRTSTSIRIAPGKKSESSDTAPELFIKGGGWVFADLFQFADIDTIVTKERLTDLISMYGPYPEVGQRIKDLWDDLLEISHLRISNDTDMSENNLSPDINTKGYETSDIMIAIGNAHGEINDILDKLIEKYPEAESEIDKIERKLVKAFMKIDINNIDDE